MIKIGSLFTGYGGLDLAVAAVFGATTVWASDVCRVEKDGSVGHHTPCKAPCTIITDRFGVPNLGDITKINWTAVPPVDVITAGWPCQPFSNAGQRRGQDDHRALWPHVKDAVRVLRPRFFVGENVSAIATARTGPELARAVADLATLGYVGSWVCVRASDVGAPHRRERIFLLAVRADAAAYTGHAADDGQRPRPEPGRRGEPAADARGEARDQWPGLRPDEPGRLGRGRPGDGAPPLLPTPTASTYGSNQSLSPGAAVRPSLHSIDQLLPTPRATDGTKGGPNQRGSSGDLMLPSAVAQLLPTPDATHGRKTTRTGPLLAGAVELLPTPSASDGSGGHERRGGARSDELLLAGLVKDDRFGQYAPAIARWHAVLGRPAPEPRVNGRLNPRFVEWMMGVPDGWVTDVPGITRPQALKALGNGVVTLQAVAALRHLAGLVPADIWGAA